MADHELTINGFDASNYRFGIVTATFNSGVTDAMLEECLKTLRSEFKVPESNITSVRVPGAADAPAILSAMAQTKKYDALIVMGAVIRGATAHFDYVNKVVSDGVTAIQVQHGLPVAFGVLMCDTQKQAEERIVLGAEFAAAAAEGARVVGEV